MFNVSRLALFAILVGGCHSNAASYDQLAPEMPSPLEDLSSRDLVGSSRDMSSPLDAQSDDLAMPMPMDLATADDLAPLDALADLAPPDDLTTLPPPMLSVRYLAANITPTTFELKPHFLIVNQGSSPVELSSLTLRYYFTKDGTPPTDLTFGCDYALIGCSNVRATFGTTTGANADEYLELSFTSGSVAGSGDTGEIQANIHPTAFDHSFNQTNDYSFDVTKTSYADWSNVTLYHDGTLLWGTEP